MIKIEKFVFNPFQLNSYVLYDETGECLLVDPGVSDEEEMQQLRDFISANSLTPKLIVNTHSHIDHLLGNKVVSEHFGISLAADPAGQLFIDKAPNSAQKFGLPFSGTKEIDVTLQEGQPLTFGKSSLKIFNTPGHADGSICLYAEEEGFIVVGDVLFYQSIGRTDFETGDYDVLQKSIWEKLFVLPDATVVYPGHGRSTTIGIEKESNPFVAIGME
ncbi:MAG: MBL fold metallo-hydrolase [Bacteroidales bacterium]|nr:MBL fold metallo-hydrolase [Bacteroidales bacterium]